MQRVVFPIAMPSVRHTYLMYCDKTNESSADILIPYERKIHLHSLTQRRLVEDAPLYLKLWVKLTRRPLVPEIVGQTDPLSFKTLQKRRFSIDICSYIGSTVTPSEKVQSWLIGIQYKLSNEPKMNSVRVDPQRGLKKRNLTIFPLKVYFSRKKSLLQSFFVWKLSAAKL